MELEPCDAMTRRTYFKALGASIVPATKKIRFFLMTKDDITKPFIFLRNRSPLRGQNTELKDYQNCGHLHAC
jgi:hypothetical protein